MAVTMQPRERWTDERLDDSFAALKAEIADTKAEMRAGFARINADIRELRREMRAGFITIVAAIIGSNAALVASSVL